MNTERADDALPPAGTSGSAGTRRHTEQDPPGHGRIAARRVTRSDVAALPGAGVLGGRRR